MPSQAIANSVNAAYNPSYVPTMVAFGGTSGIGEAIARLFATHTKGRAHIILVGRNKVAADKIIASLYKPAPEIANDSTYEFISCDILSMKNIHVFNEDLKKKLDKVNYLVLSAGTVDIKNSRNETEDGLDYKMVTRFYSRFAILHGVLPLLRKAKDGGEDASVLSVLGPGPASWVDMEDLGLKKKYTIFRAIVATSGYNDFMLKVRYTRLFSSDPCDLELNGLLFLAFSEREPDIGFTHIHPGFVDTGMLRSQSWIKRIFMRPIAWLFTISAEKCGEWMLYGLLETKKGFTRRNDNGDEKSQEGMAFATAEQRQAFWDHCVSSVTVSDA